MPPSASPTSPMANTCLLKNPPKGKAPLVRQRSFQLENPIKGSRRGDVFFVEPDFEELCSAVAAGRPVLYVGPPATGKTTALHRFRQRLSNHHRTFIITLEEGAALRDASAFWSLMGDAVAMENIHISTEMSASSEEEFRELLTGAGTTTKKDISNVPAAILIVDNADLLLTAPVEIQRSFFAALERLRAPPAGNLQSIILAGSPELLSFLEDETVIKDAAILQAAGFSRQHVEEIFHQYEISRNVQLDPSIIEDIYIKTNGLPGLVSLCGYLLDKLYDQCRRLARSPDVSDWVLASTVLVEYMLSWAPLSPLRQFLREHYADIRLLVDDILSATTVKVPTGRTSRPAVFAHKLWSLGLARPTMLGEQGVATQYAIASPIMRTFAATFIHTEVARRVVPGLPRLNYDQAKRQRISDLVEKLANVPGATTSSIPAFALEQCAFMLSYFPKQYVILPELINPRLKSNQQQQTSYIILIADFQRHIVVFGQDEQEAVASIEDVARAYRTESIIYVQIEVSSTAD